MKIEESDNCGDVESYFSPLLLFYAKTRLDFPKYRVIDPNEMPNPYKKLLVHKRDMTSTLHNFYKELPRVEVLQRINREDGYSRMVTLLCESINIRVEFGAITIYLKRFTQAARSAILEGVKPLGRILFETEINYKSNPGIYFEIDSDLQISKVLRIERGQNLYGRCNLISDSDDIPLAEIVEILPVIPSHD